MKLTERKGRVDIGLEWGAGGRCRYPSFQVAEGRHGVIWRTETKDGASPLVRLPCVNSKLQVVCRDARTSLCHYSTLIYHGETHFDPDRFTGSVHTSQILSAPRERYIQ